MFSRLRTTAPSNRLLGAVGAVMALVFVVAACGGSETAETPGPSATQEQPSIPVAGGTTQEQPSIPVAGGTTQEQTSVPPAPLATKSATANADRMVGGAVGNLAPEFGGIEAWINGGPLTMEELRGRVVLIDFWTYTCINCIRT